MYIQILIDNVDSWLNIYINELIEELINMKCKTKFINNSEKVEEGDILLILSCNKIFTNLDLNKYNLVVHESSLPKGKGWSPMTWQVLEGLNRIPITLFEAINEVDSGVIYEQDVILLEGHELIEEIRLKQWCATKNLILKFIEKYPFIKSSEQVGDSTYYKRRNESNSQVDVEKSIAEQFNLLRIVDNERYPAFFILNSQKYILKITKQL